MSARYITNEAFDPKEKEGKKKKDTRSDQDILVDHLIAINADPKELRPADYERYLKELELTDAPATDKRSLLVFEEGFGGKDGNPSNRKYWEVKNGPRASPDTTVFSHANPKVRRFFELGGYRAFPEVVTVSVEIREIFDVDLVRGTFRVSMLVSTRWYDSFFDRSEFEGTEEVYAHSIPYITLDHVDEGDSPEGVPRDAAGLTLDEKHSGRVQRRKGLDPPGVLYNSQRIQASFRVQTKLHSFPVDIQTLPINIRMWGSNVRGDIDHGRVLLPLTCSMKLAHDHMEWRPYQATSFVNRGRFDRQDLQVNITLQRIPTFFFQNVYVILFLMPAISFFAFAIPPEGTGIDATFVDGYEARCQISLTLMLTSVAYKFYLAGMLPKVPYLTMLDHYIYFSFITILLIFVANSIVLVVERYQTGHLFPSVHTNFDDKVNTAELVDKCLAYILSIGFVLANINHFWYLRRDSKRLEIDKALMVASDEREHELGLAKKKPKTSSELKSSIKELQNQNGLGRWSSKRTLIRDVLTFKFLKEKFKEHKENENIKCLSVRRRRKKYVDIQLKLESQSGKVLVKTKSKQKCECEACVARDKELDSSPEQLELDSVLRMAQISEQNATTLSHHLISHKVTKSHLYRIFNNGAGASTLDRLLDDMNIHLENRVKLCATLNKSEMFKPYEHPDGTVGATVLAIQGSGSYLMQNLKLNGQLLKTNDFISHLDAHMSQLVGKKFNIQNAANLLLGTAMFSSPMLKSEYVFSARQLQDKDKDKNKAWVVKTQLVAGYLDQMIPDKDDAAALVVDIGTGKIAFGYGERKQVNGQRRLVLYDVMDEIKLPHTEPDVKFNREAKFDGKTDLMYISKYMDVRKPFQEGEFTNLNDQEILEHVAKKLVHHEKMLNHVCNDVLDWAKIPARNTPIHIFSTSAARTWSKESELIHGGCFREATQNFADFIAAELGRTSPDHHHGVTYEILSNEREARCEHRAYELALSHAKLELPENDVNIIRTAVKDRKIGNIAWGSGSMQGLPDTETTIFGEFGLKVAQSVIKKTATEIAGKEYIFQDAGALNRAKSMLVKIMQNKAPRLQVDLNTGSPSSKKSTLPAEFEGFGV